MSLTRRHLLRWGAGSLAAAGLPTSLSSLVGSADASLARIKALGQREDEEFWQAVRKCFALDPGIVYLNNGSLGPPPLAVLKTLEEASHELASNPTEKMWGPVGSRVEEVRTKVASLLGAGPDDIALTRNTTEGISTVGMGLGLVAGDEVITTDQEHPGGAGVWQFLETRGIQRVTLPVPLPPAGFDGFLEKLEAAITAKTKVLALPHLTFGSGHLLPLSEVAALAKRRAIPLCVDGAHPPGMLPVNLPALGCSSYASSSHKWLLSPAGTGTLFVSPELRERLAPRVFTGTGFTGKTARRFDDFGTRDAALVLAQGAAIDFHLQIGPERIQRRIRFLTDYFRKGLSGIARARVLTPADAVHSGGLTTFSLEGVAHGRAIERLREKGHFVLRALPELDAIRVSTGIYNTTGELDQLLTRVREIASRLPPDLSTSRGR
jgi:selenocysteine lyase/cysteine desulfurase